MTDLDTSGFWSYSLMIGAVVSGLLLSRIVPKWSAVHLASALAIFIGASVIVAVEAVHVSDGGIDSALGLAALVLLATAVTSGLLMLAESLRGTSSRDDLHDG